MRIPVVIIMTAYYFFHNKRIFPKSCIKYIHYTFIYVLFVDRNFWRYSNVPRTCLEARSYCAGKGGLLIAFPNIDVLTEINGINAIGKLFII